MRIRSFYYHSVLLCLLVGVFGLGFGTGGCGKKEIKEYGGILRIGIYHKPTEINPLTTDSSISANLLNLLFNALTRFSGEGKVVPELAERWELTPDHLTWTFHLRRDVYFHDKVPLDAEDVKFTIDTIKTMGVGNSQYLGYIKDIRVLDPHTLQIVLSKPDNLLLANLGEVFIAPERLLKGSTDYGEYNHHPIGSGPYRFVKQDENEIVLEANDQSFGGRPHLDRIIVQVFPSQQASLNNLIAEKIDMAFLINPEDFGALSQIPTIRIYDNWFPILQLLTFNLKNELFTDPEVRRALNFAVDKDQIIDRILKGKGRRAAGMFFPGSKDENPQVAPYPYRPDLALQILQKRGWVGHDQDFILKKGSQRFEFTALCYQGEEFYSKILQMISEQFRQIGIQMNITLLPFDEYVEQVLRKRGFESSLIHLVFRSYYDNNFSFWHSSQIADGLNFSSYSNPKVDELLEEARLSPDPDRRRRAVLEFQQVLHDAPPGIFLFWREMPIAIHKRFRGVPEKRMESLRDLVNVWAPKEEQAHED